MVKDFETPPDPRRAPAPGSNLCYTDIEEFELVLGRGRDLVVVNTMASDGYTHGRAALNSGFECFDDTKIRTLAEAKELCDERPNCRLG